jgi:hypothetical protein
VVDVNRTTALIKQGFKRFGRETRSKILKARVTIIEAQLYCQEKLDSCGDFLVLKPYHFPVGSIS